MADTSFNIACEKLQVAQITQLYQLFSLLKFVRISTATASMRLVVYANKEKWKQ